RLLGSLAALASFPVYVVIRGVPTALEVGVFSCLAVPILVVYYLSRTGRYESAHVLSAVALTGLAALIATCSGGVTSFAAIWLVVVPLEAALSASRRIVALAAAFALAAAGLLLLLDLGGLFHVVIHPDRQHMLAALGIVSAALYAAGLGLGGALLVRGGNSLLHTQEDQYRLLAHTMSEVVACHGRNGPVLSVSQAAGSMFGVQANELLGNGLFDRVHVVDRPAYLAALADVASLNEQRSIELRI